eukprot:NODE_437_length_1503_cov_100.899709_g405_i0.p1 GENE.NODE_437_length_1503_cov_100.899709_g405_i0~~NODE_437_length_1503_cov_100.899709_g405_i0.p1  ORF type:complete len:430 (+),score=80.88 NODE_437_length_1503_cov_100.899709_g405_i0:149-1438(+)
MLTSTSRKPKHYQSQTDTKLAFYQPDGSGRDYYIALQQKHGHYQPPTAPCKPTGSASTLRSENIITGALEGSHKNISPELQTLVKAPPKHVPADDPIVDDVRKKLNARGGRTGFRGLTRTLRIMDDNGNKRLDREELLNGLQTYGIHPTQDQMDNIFAFFDTDGSGQISVTEFMRGLRPPMNERRRDLVRQAFALLDVVADGLITFVDLKKNYDTAQHPDVLSGAKTDQQVLAEFMQGWDKDGDATVTKDEFFDYYEDISASIDLDDYFELMIRNAWHISGGEGVCQNTTCRRVLVIHADGRQSVEEVKNDLGVRPDDTEEMRRRLELQGHTDIASVCLTGKIDVKKNKLQQQARPKAVAPQLPPRASRKEFDVDRAVASHGAGPPPGMWKTTNKDMFKVEEPPNSVPIPFASGYMGHKQGRGTFGGGV